MRSFGGSVLVGAGSGLTSGLASLAVVRPERSRLVCKGIVVILALPGLTGSATSPSTAVVAANFFSVS